MNIELAKKVLDYIEANPQEHDQDSFLSAARNVCGTTACIAGHAMLLSGKFRILNPTKSYPFLAALGNDHEADYEVEGQRLLGLSDRDTNELFYETGNSEAIEYLGNLIHDAEETTTEVTR